MDDYQRALGEYVRKQVHAHHAEVEDAMLRMVTEAFTEGLCPILGVQRVPGWPPTTRLHRCDQPARHQGQCRYPTLTPLDGL